VEPVGVVMATVLPEEVNVTAPVSPLTEVTPLPLPLLGLKMSDISISYRLNFTV